MCGTEAREIDVLGGDPGFVNGAPLTPPPCNRKKPSSALIYIGFC
jgi:hypothetical protein